MECLADHGVVLSNGNTASMLGDWTGGVARSALGKGKPNQQIASAQGCIWKPRACWISVNAYRLMRDYCVAGEILTWHRLSFLPCLGTSVREKRSVGFYEKIELGIFYLSLKYYFRRHIYA